MKEVSGEGFSPLSPVTKILVLGGTGDTGKVVAAMLANAGHNVTIIGRNREKLQKIREKGLTIELKSNDGKKEKNQLKVEPNAFKFIGTIDDLPTPDKVHHDDLFDVVISCLPYTCLQEKDFERLPVYTTHEATWMIALNGVPIHLPFTDYPNASKLTPLPRGKRIIDTIGAINCVGVVFSKFVASHHTDPTKAYIGHNDSLLTIGEFSEKVHGKISRRCLDIATLFSRNLDVSKPHVCVEIVEPRDLIKRAFEKLRVNMFNPVAAATALPISAIIRHPKLRELVIGLAHEVEASYTLLTNDRLPDNFDEELEKRKNSPHYTSTYAAIENGKEESERETLLGIRQLCKDLNHSDIPLLTNSMYVVLEYFDDINRKHQDLCDQQTVTIKTATQFLPPIFTRKEEIERIRERFIQAVETQTVEDYAAMLLHFRTVEYHSHLYFLNSDYKSENYNQVSRSAASGETVFLTFFSNGQPIYSVPFVIHPSENKIFASHIALGATDAPHPDIIDMLNDDTLEKIITRQPYIFPNTTISQANTVEAHQPMAYTRKGSISPTSPLPYPMPKTARPYTPPATPSSPVDFSRHSDALPNARGNTASQFTQRSAKRHKGDAQIIIPSSRPNAAAACGTHPSSSLGRTTNSSGL